MKSYNQQDKRWSELSLGKTNLTMKDAGCFVVSLAMIAEQLPNEVLGILNEYNAFDEKGLLHSNIAAMALKLGYKGNIKIPPQTYCIAETDHFKKEGIPQHFFVRLEDGSIIDPLDGKTKANPYHIVSYRLFKLKKKTIVTPTLTITKKETWFTKIIDFIIKILEGVKINV